MLVSLGKITVTTAGTPVRVAATVTNANTVFFSTLSTQVGQQIYIGLSGLVKATFVNVLKILQKPLATPATLDSWVVQSNVSMAAVDLSTIFVDADTSGDSVLVSYLTV
jgi:hypothetical protein